MMSHGCHRFALLLLDWLVYTACRKRPCPRWAAVEFDPMEMRVKLIDYDGGELKHAARF
jgi:hypothetical protein